VPFTTLISTDILSNHLDSEWVVADCRYDLQSDVWGTEQYLAAHIPGALYVSLSHDLSAPLSGTNGRHPLPSSDVMTATFSRLGITDDIQVVAYDQDSGMFASRLWWMLRYAGHRNVAVLDGGWAKWIAEGRPTRSGNETRAAAAFSPRWQSNAQIDVNGVAALQNDSKTLLIDARAPERFEGRVEPLDRLPGHIPGAANRPYRGNLAADGTMLPPEALREQLQRDLRGHTPAQTVMYCGSGVSACHNLLAMEHAGLPGARLFVGSWSEWSADPDRPVETGPSRR
jgi:thiosulfate/3-mercaptopyruvate sulfurtransferase